jgi:chromosome segregation ATPase
LAIGVTSYFRQQAQARDAQQQALKQENQNRIERLRLKVAEINNRLQAADKPSLKEKLSDLSERLNKLSRQLEDISKMSSDQLQEISQDCDEIEKKLEKIEKDVTTLQRLLPEAETNRDPIKV